MKRNHNSKHVTRAIVYFTRVYPNGCTDKTVGYFFVSVRTNTRHHHHRNDPENKKATCMASVCKLCHTWYSFSSLATCTVGEDACHICRPPPRPSPSATGDFHTRRCWEGGREDDSNSFESAILSISSPLACHISLCLLSR